MKNIEEEMFKKLKNWAKRHYNSQLDVNSIDELFKIETISLRFGLHKNEESKIPEEIKLLKNLKSLKMRGDVSDISAICNLPKLKSITIKHNNFLKKLPEEMEKLNNLRYLNLIDYNKIIDMSVISKLENLKKLEFHLKSSSLPDLSKLKNLRYLHIAGTLLKEFPVSYCKLKNLKVLMLTNHSIFDFPPEIGNLTKLTTFFSKTHKLGYHLSTVANIFPKEIENLKNLRYLCCNVIEIQEEVCNLPKLKSFDYGGHKLHSLPKSIDKILALGFIRIKQNMYTLNTLKDKKLLLDGFYLLKEYQDDDNIKKFIYRYNQPPLIKIKPIPQEETEEKETAIQDVVSKIIDNIKSEDEMREYLKSIKEELSQQYSDILTEDELKSVLNDFKEIIITTKELKKRWEKINFIPKW